MVLSEFFALGRLTTCGSAQELERAGSLLSNVHESKR
jgi:hypothetical protein